MSNSTSSGAPGGEPRFEAPQSQPSGEKGFFSRYLIIILAIGILLSGGFYYFNNSGTSGPFADYERRMAADKAGGATPQETLALFIEAARAGDVERAASYFLPDENGKRDVWLKALEEKRAAGELEAIIGLLEQAVPAESEALAGDFEFLIKDNLGNIQAVVDMELNNYSNVWKIESL